MLEWEIDEYNIEDIIAEECEEAYREGLEEDRREVYAEAVEALIYNLNWTREKAEKMLRHV